jgi:ribonuclease P protein component
MANSPFDKSVRLLNSSDFSPVFSGAQVKSACPELLILARKTHGDHARVGIVVAKKHVNLAVQRNRIKRLIRESFRQQQCDLPKMDIVVLVRKGAANRDNKRLTQLLQKQWVKLTNKANAAPESTT